MIEHFCGLIIRPEKAENVSGMDLMVFNDLGLVLENSRISSVYIRCVTEVAPFTMYESYFLSLASFSFSISLLRISIIMSKRIRERGSPRLIFGL